MPQLNRLLYVFVTAEEAALCVAHTRSPISPEGQEAGKGGVGGDQAGHAPCRAVRGAIFKEEGAVPPTVCHPAHSGSDGASWLRS